MPRGELAERFRVQAGWCGRLGSPVYEELLKAAADDLEAEGPVWDVIEPFAGEDARFTHHLRLMGAVHRIVLRGETDPDWTWPWMRELVADRADDIRGDMRPVQTNEVGRSAALLGGFLVIANETGLGLRVLELGASAGLNLRWDRFRYDAPDWGWGDSASPARIPADYEGGGRPPLPRWVWVLDRAGCDQEPIDVTTDEGRIAAMSFVWPGQDERFALLESAIEVARRTPVRVDRADAAEWLERELRGPHSGTATVVYHSIVWGYLPDETKQRITATLEKTGARAESAAPLAWLRMEPGADQADLTLTTWPGGEERLLANVGYHGRPVRWLT